MRISFVLLDLLFFFFGLMRLVRSDAPLLRKARIPVSAVSSMPRRGEQPPIRAMKMLFGGSWRLVVRCQSQSRQSSAVLAKACAPWGTSFLSVYVNILHFRGASW